jgi:DNA-binding NtrC family response regulator
MDDGPAALRREQPDLLILSGSVREPTAESLTRLARDLEIYTLALLEPTDTERGERAAGLAATAVLPKPIKPNEAVATVRTLVERRKLQQSTGISGQSPGVHELLIKLEQMGPVSTTVLVQGESGTGKELVAKALHDLSPRRGKAFIAVNCSALPETLLESELFGHEKGAFTGAAERRLGRFELADHGTIFLDEIGDVPLAVQVKLLRVLESRTFFRVGGTQPIKVDVRVIAATNRALRDLVAVGEFREDLYYRLSVLNLYLPPLRDRREDIPILVRRFIREFSKVHDRQFRGIAAEALQRLVQAPWPGNVRQLRNLIESMVVLAPGTEIRASDIPADVLEGPTVLPVLAGGRLGGSASSSATVPAPELEFIFRGLMDLRIQVEELRRRLEDRGPRSPGVQVIEVPEAGLTPIEIDSPEPKPSPTVLYHSGMTMADVERATITAALRECQGNRRKAAAMLGIGERTLYRKIKEYQIA